MQRAPTWIWGARSEAILLDTLTLVQTALFVTHPYSFLLGIIITSSTHYEYAADSPCDQHQLSKAVGGDIVHRLIEC